MTFEVSEIKFSFLEGKDKNAFFELFKKEMKKYASNTEYTFVEKPIHGKVVRLKGAISPNTLNNVLSQIQKKSSFLISRVDYRYMFDITEVEVR